MGLNGTLYFAEWAALYRGAVSTGLGLWLSHCIGPEGRCLLRQLPELIPKVIRSGELEELEEPLGSHLSPFPVLWSGQTVHPQQMWPSKKTIPAPLSHSQVFCPLPVPQQAQLCKFLLLQVAVGKETNPPPAACPAGAPACFSFLEQTSPVHPSSSSDHLCLCPFLSCLLHTWFIPDFLKCSGQIQARCYSCGAFPSPRLGAIILFHHR